jgi:uncharacterized protein YfdQ (DUF2303 family)
MNSKTEAVPSCDEGIKAIAALADKGASIELAKLETKGLAEGLPDAVPYIVDKRGAGGKSVYAIKDLIEAYRLRPERRRGTATVTTLQSFIDLVNRHKDDHSAVFAATAWPSPALTGVIDYHEAKGAPRHGQHRVLYPFPVTEEIKAWIGNNGKSMEQAEFAAFLEEHAAELASPFDGDRDIYEQLFKERLATPTELIALSRNLEVHVGGKFKRAERLSSGERTVEFVEEHTNTKGEKVDVPGAFMISVPAFVDSEAVRIPARLRYRATGGTIVWFYHLYRWEIFIRERVKHDLLQAGKETALPTFEGSPEADKG